MIKRSDGSIYPCQIFIKFLYSHNYGYTFICSVSPLTLIVPFKSKIKYNPDSLLFCIANNKNGEITEIS